MIKNKTGNGRERLKLSEFMLREDQREALKTVATREGIPVAQLLRYIIDSHFGIRHLDTSLRGR